MKSKITTFTKTNSVVIALTVLLILIETARAEVKNFSFQGVISDVEDNELVLDGSITNGSVFEGFYIFDSAAVDSNTDPTVGDYQFTNSPYGVGIKVGNYTFRTDPEQIEFILEVVNRTDSDNFLFRSYFNICSPPLLMNHIAWQLNGSTNVLTNDFLPVIPPLLSSWEGVSGFTVEGLDNSFVLRGTVNFITDRPAVIPERPSISLGDAVEVKWPSQLGYFYQVQSSEDLETWTDVGESMLGNGTVQSKFFARQAGKNIYYRTDISNLPR